MSRRPHTEPRGFEAINPPRLDADSPTRGASVQGEMQSAKGGPQGANQGGASRGGSRVEPSHLKRAARRERAKGT